MLHPCEEPNVVEEWWQVRRVRLERFARHCAEHARAALDVTRAVLPTTPFHTTKCTSGVRFYHIEKNRTLWRRRQILLFPAIEVVGSANYRD
jgi:hypothetical protein